MSQAAVNIIRIYPHLRTTFGDLYTTGSNWSQFTKNLTNIRNIILNLSYVCPKLQS